MLARQAFAAYVRPLCRANISTGEPFLARHSNNGPPSRSRGSQEPQPGNSVAVSNDTSNQVGRAAEQWAEVVDKTSGQVYYWNQQTGAAKVLHARPSLSALVVRCHATCTRTWCLAFRG